MIPLRMCGRDPKTQVQSANLGHPTCLGHSGKSRFLATLGMTNGLFVGEERVLVELPQEKERGRLSVRTNGAGDSA
jgi:hypothetical protein